MIQNTNSFVEYFDSVRRRTMNFIRVIPADRFDWSPRENEFTCRDLVWHLAAAEKMFVGVVMEGQWRYPGHDQTRASSLDEAIAYLEACHAESMTALRNLNDAELYQPRPSLKGPPVKTWRWLMAMVEHEIHHRSQLAVYLTLMGIKPPHLYGLGIEDIVALTTTWKLSQKSS